MLRMRLPCCPRCGPSAIPLVVRGFRGALAAIGCAAVGPRGAFDPLSAPEPVTGLEGGPDSPAAQPQPRRLSRYSELEDYTSPLRLTVAPDDEGRWRILEEVTESQP